MSELIQPNLFNIYPPETAEDIANYPLDDVVEGYRAYNKGDLEPGDNHTPGYRWGWLNRKRDHQREDDGYDWLRSAYFDYKKSLN